MADKNSGKRDGEEPIDGNDVDKSLNPKTNPDQESDVFGSLTPQSESLDLSEIVDYTGTIGAAPGDIGSGMADDGPAFSEDLQTQMIDDDFYQQIQVLFPGESGSATPSSDDLLADRSQSISLRLERPSLAI